MTIRDTHAYFLPEEDLTEDRKSNVHEALAAYDQAIRLKPDYAEVYNNRGIVKRALGQYYRCHCRL